MNDGSPRGTWRQRVYQAVVLLLLVALGARVAADLLAPLIPALVVGTLLTAIFWLLFRRK